MSGYTAFELDLDALLASGSVVASGSGGRTRMGLRSKKEPVFGERVWQALKDSMELAFTLDEGCICAKVLELVVRSVRKRIARRGRGRRSNLIALVKLSLVTYQGTLGDQASVEQSLVYAWKKKFVDATSLSWNVSGASGWICGSALVNSSLLLYTQRQ